VPAYEAIDADGKINKMDAEIKINKKAIWLSIMVGSIAIAVLSATPYLNYINFVLCLGIALGGFIGTIVYKAKNPISPKIGATIGFLSGIFGGLIWALVSAILYQTGNITLLAFYIKGAKLNVALIFPGIICLSMIFGTLGGLFGGAIFKPKKS